MIEQDTIKLLHECDAGVKMGTASIEDVSSHVQDPAFRSCLTHCKQEHLSLQKQIRSMLDRYQDQGKEPNPMVKGMSWLKTNVKLAVDNSDHTIADLMTDGCSMGVKSLNRYLNQYEAADEASKDLAKQLIRLEEQLASDLQKFL